MKAAVLHAIGDLRVEDVAQPTPGPGEVLVCITNCGVCGSDVPRVFSKGTYRFPTIVGHEFAGTVASACDLPLGTPVTVFPLLWCGKCSECERGAYARCADYGYLGSRSDGGFAEYVVAPRRNLLVLPAGVSLEEGALTEPAAVALHAVKRGSLQAGESVAVLGAGPIGLLVAQWARAMGAARVIIGDVAPKSLALARELGFSDVIDTKSDPVKQIEALTGGRGADVTVEAAGVPATLTAAVAAAAPGGRVVLLGNPSGDVQLPAKLISQIMRRELALLGTWNSSYSAFLPGEGLGASAVGRTTPSSHRCDVRPSPVDPHLAGISETLSGQPDDWRTVLAAVAAGTIRLKPLITHRFGLARARDAVAVLRDRREFVAKVLIKP